ncbi:cytokine receptor-like [Tropilaelaps mercedesae]|uniref:Cytokine receptor-like n=1 Tax=Tropilaelaps mercedesae TaxID=418985 RepID=A0A1V9X545_9ACAR|nr:cytokine receptor-like [Tropilaelaps mercedesae]
MKGTVVRSTGGWSDQRQVLARPDLPLTVSVEVGQEIRLNCRLVSDKIIGVNATIDASNLRFKRLDRSDPFLDESDPFVERIDERTIAFVKPNATVDDSGPYTCVANENGTNYPGCINTVEVGSPPKMVRDFTCTVMEFVNMTCSWKNPDNGRVSTNYTIEVVRGLTVFRQWMPCPINLTTPNSCTWTTSTDPYFEKYAFKFKFRINGTNSLGNDSWEYVLDHDSIVKLPPVVTLRYANLTQRTVTVTWRQPVEATHRIQATSADPSPGKIIYQVELWRNAAEPEIVEMLDVEQLSYDNLLPNMEYRVTVRCYMDKVQRFDLYSDPASVTFKTPKAKPDGPPPIDQSGFLYKLFDDQRTVSLLFIETPRDHWNDNFFNYIIQVCPEQASAYQCRNQTASRSLVEIEGLYVSTRYDISIWSNNSLGVSDQASMIKIFSHSEILPDPSDISVVLNAASATISWTMPPTLQDVELERALYWCEGYVVAECNGTVNMKILDGPVTSATINVTRPRDFIYGVAITDRRSGRSSGSVWSTCVAQAGAFVGQVRELKVEQDTDTTMRLRWNRICNAQRHYIGGYQADVCRISHDDAPRLVLSTDACQRHEKTTLAGGSNVSTSTPRCRTQNFTLADNDDEYMLDGLEKGEAYRIVVRALDNKSGRYTPDSSAVCAVAEGGWGVHMIVGIVVGGAMGLMVLVFSLYVLAKWMQRKLDAAKELKVTLPAPLQQSGGTGYSDFITRLNGCNRNGHDVYIDHTNVDGSTLTEFPRRGSHSSLDMVRKWQQSLRRRWVRIDDVARATSWILSVVVV